MQKSLYFVEMCKNYNFISNVGFLAITLFPEKALN